MTFKEIWETAGAVILSLGGGGAIVILLSGWLGKIWAERILATDRAKYAREIEELKSNLERTSRMLQGEIEKTILVTKTQFETEFVALREIWRNVSLVRAAMAQLRPHLQVAALGAEGWVAERFNPFEKNVQNLLRAVDDNSPFYPEEIYVALDELIRLTVDERNDAGFRLDDRFTEAWIRRGNANFERYIAASERVSGLMRTRISKLSVVGRDGFPELAKGN